MATEKQIESMVTEDDEVAMERLQIVRPQKILCNRQHMTV